MRCFPRMVEGFLAIGTIAAIVSMIFMAPNDCYGQTALIRQTFDGDPNWEGVNNLSQVTPIEVSQDFGYRLTQNAHGARSGEVGGRFWRSDAPAFYAQPIEPLSLDDKLTLAGRFRVTDVDGASAVVVGWFNSQTLGWRPQSWIGFWIDNGRQVRVEYNTQTNQCGGFRFPAEKPLTIGQSYHWTYVYDPHSDEGQGRMTMTVQGADLDRPLVFSGTLWPGHRAAGAKFDRFGFMNLQRPGDSMEVYFDELEVNGSPQNFDVDPQWDAQGNQAVFVDRSRPSAQDYGFCPFRYGGVVGGRIWRNDPHQATAIGHYADDVGSLTLDRALVARGKFLVEEGAPDSGVLLGWFNASHNQGWPPTDFVGALLEGPSDVGHYFRPYCAAQGVVVGEGKKGPVFYPDRRWRQWSVAYRPDDAGGGGTLRVELDGQVEELQLSKQSREAGAKLNRFGLMTLNYSGGDALTIYFDDLEYTSGRLPQ